MKGVVRSFKGTFEQLEWIISAAGVPGEWETMPAGYFRFVCRTGAILNWWPSTGTVNFQGPCEPSSDLELALRRVAKKLPGTSSHVPRLGGN